ncbi:MAG: hypothetical protein ABIG34_00265 [Candidatus Peregrinibacteria bacterium]
MERTGATQETGISTPQSSPNGTGGFRRLCANVATRARNLLGMNGEAKEEESKPDPFLHKLYTIHQAHARKPYENFEEFLAWWQDLPRDGQTALTAEYLRKS